MTAIEKGCFITIEGGDGTGKTTQIKKLTEYLTDQGVEVIATREPGGTEEAEKIRNLLVQRDGGNWDPISEVMLLMAARREHLSKKIWPALEAGKWVISDRFVDSSFVFQGFGMGIDHTEIVKLYQAIAGDFMPDLTLVFDIDAKLGLERSNRQMEITDVVAESTEDRYERMGLSFHQKLRQGFIEIAKKYPERCVLCDASVDIESLHKEICAIIDERLFAREQRLNINE